MTLCQPLAFEGMTDEKSRTASWAGFVRASCLVAIATVAGAAAGAQQQDAVSVAVARNSVSLDALQEWDAVMDRMIRNGDLTVASRLVDRSLPGRAHEYLAQTVNGIPVVGGGISRQLEAGATVSLFGALLEDIDVDVTPALSAAEAALLVEEAWSGRVAAGRRPALVVLPLPDGAHALAYHVVASNGRAYYVDAGDGRILHSADLFRRQSAVGAGSDSRGRQRKLSTTRTGSRFQAWDRLRPAEIVTLDARFDFLRVGRLIEGHFGGDLPLGARTWVADDVAADTDNHWEDPAVVEAHVHTGWTYDYLHARHGWQGIDGANGRIFSIVNVDFGIPNAFMAPPPFGPEGTGVYVYGRASDGMREAWLSSLDVVAHELMHGVTHVAVSRRTGDPAGLGGGFPTNTRPGPASFTDDRGRTWTCGPDFWCVDGRFVLGSNESGAVNEAFSDIAAAGVGFFREDAGAPADWVMDSLPGEDPVRSLADPGSLSVVGGADRPYPDAYAGRYEFVILRAQSTANPGQPDEDDDEPAVLWTYSEAVFVDGRFAFSVGGPGYGGEHWNSTILSHAFHLAIEGGVNRTTGLSVDGVGDAGRGEVERIFFRAITELMPPAATLPVAAGAIRQAAADLDPGGDAQRAVGQALRAVGLHQLVPRRR